MLPIGIYPYMNLEDLNLDYILKKLMKLESDVQDFVEMNAIKYADPIQWNITTQYEKNTIVIDPATGSAYLSVRPVPAGIDISRTEYWTEVFNLSALIQDAVRNLTEHDAGISTVATFASAPGEWIMWKDVLYIATSQITPGDAYTVGGNIERLTVEEAVGTLAGLIDQNAEAIAAEAETRALADEDLREEIELIKSAEIVATPEQFGAVGDGATDDADAIAAAIATGKPVVFGHGKRYAITRTIEAPAAARLYGNGAAVVAISDMTAVMIASYVDNLEIDADHKEIKFGIQVTDASLNARITNCTVHGLRHSTLDVHGILCTDTTHRDNVCVIANNVVYDLYSTDNGVVDDYPGTAKGISTYTASRVVIADNVIYDILSTDDGYGIHVLDYYGTNSPAIVCRNFVRDVANTGIKIQIAGAIVSDNTVIKSRSSITADMVYCVRNYGDSVTIKNNSFVHEGSGNYCVLLDGGKGAKLTNNVFDTAECALIIRIAGTAENAEIAGNRIKSTYAGTTQLLSLESANANVHNNSIDTAAPVIIRNQGGSVRIVDNEINGPATGQNVLCNYPTNVIISGNRCAGLIQFQHMATNVTIDDNVAASVIFIAGVTNGIISNNRLTAANTGIGCATSSKNAIITNNRIAGATAVAANYSNAMIIKNNIIEPGATISTTGATGAVVQDNVTAA